MMMMIDCDWPWWIMFAAVMVSSYFREMRLRTERNDPRCTLFYTYQPVALKNHLKAPSASQRSNFSFQEGPLLLRSCAQTASV